MSQEVDLAFSPNQAEVLLKFDDRELTFTSEEFRYYRNLFHIFDLDSEGNLCLAQPLLRSFLLRFHAPWHLLKETLLSLGVDLADPHCKIDFKRWLRFCKAVAQGSPRFDLFACSEETVRHLYNVTIIGLHFFEDHVKYRLRVSLTLLSKEEKVVENKEIERRYSDFDHLFNLLRLIKGVVVPPLPPKHWIPSFVAVAPISANTPTASSSPAPSHNIDEQRVADLQYFLHEVTAHPVLSKSFALQAFLATQSMGLSALVDIYRTSADMMEGLPPPPVSLTDGLLQSAQGFLSSLWGTLSEAAQTAGLQRRRVDDGPHIVTSSLRLLDALERVSRTFEAVVNEEKAQCAAILRLVQSFQLMAEGDSVAGPGLRAVHETGHLVVCQQQAVLAQRQTRIVAPLRYLGRYHESLRRVLDDRAAIINAVDQAKKYLQEAQKVEADLERLQPSPASIDLFPRSGYIRDRQDDMRLQTLQNRYEEARSNSQRWKDCLDERTKRLENLDAEAVRDCERLQLISDRVKAILLSKRLFAPPIGLLGGSHVALFAKILLELLVVGNLVETVVHYGR
eukprot:scaffold268_cov210-Ochromonas_danica.AAC.37